MKILKLNQQATVSKQVDSIVGWEEKTVFEPVFVVAEHIVSFAFFGATQIKMSSGENIVVQESPEEIIRQINGEATDSEVAFWSNLGSEA